jgi:hypothetical protein
MESPSRALGVAFRDGLRRRLHRLVSGLFGLFSWGFSFRLFRLFRCGLAHVPVVTVVSFAMCVNTPKLLAPGDQGE